VPAGPPPAHRWAERDPAAAARLAAARAAVTAIADAHTVPVENLLAPDTLRRLSWDPPQPTDAGTVSLALAGFGARPWQVELTAGPVAEALNSPEAEAQKPGDG
jgi:ribonuclease D